MSSAIHGIKFSEKAIDTFTDQVALFGTVETGGVLMGYWEAGILHVAEASGPGPNATHESIYFRADPNYIDMFIDMAHANSDGRLVYLGEWHTHPQIHPEPSDVDYNSLYEIAESSEQFALLTIIGAVNFSKQRFNDQHIAILKYANDRRFYKL
ncbi:Mov34/MPN/PAD-1 family protein [Flaviaesturariibacter amylovorans]|uniref:JAB domain-containing protein n=1 Tax=Flaviaesturariibacter amylovorans TaxID=1084520 RepID=A0ABP8H5W4_9BACT